MCSDLEGELGGGEAGDFGFLGHFGDIYTWYVVPSAEVSKAS